MILLPMLPVPMHCLNPRCLCTLCNTLSNNPCCLDCEQPVSVSLLGHLYRFLHPNHTNIGVEDLAAVMQGLHPEQLHSCVMWSEWAYEQL